MSAYSLLRLFLYLNINLIFRYIKVIFLHLNKNNNFKIYKG